MNTLVLISVCMRSHAHVHMHFHNENEMKGRCSCESEADSCFLMALNKLSLTQCTEDDHLCKQFTGLHSVHVYIHRYTYAIS